MDAASLVDLCFEREESVQIFTAGRTQSQSGGSGMRELYRRLGE